MTSFVCTTSFPGSPLFLPRSYFEGGRKENPGNEVIFCWMPGGVRHHSQRVLGKNMEWLICLWSRLSKHLPNVRLTVALKLGIQTFLPFLKTANFNGLVTAVYSRYGDNQRRHFFFMFILIQGWCAVTSAYRRCFVYLDREWSSGLFLLSSVARDGSSERWGHEPRIHFCNLHFARVIWGKSTTARSLFFIAFARF